jgi:hypothetical protein
VGVDWGAARSVAAGVIIAGLLLGLVGLVLGAGRRG